MKRPPIRELPLGNFKTPELAHAAFKDATFKMRDEFARVS
jgi:hypothetical protein